MQNIVHVIFSLEAGGSENLLVDIANEQVQMARVTIIIINRQYSQSVLQRIDPQVAVHTLNRKPRSKWPVRCLMRLWTLLLWIRPTVIHCHHAAIIRLLAGFEKRTVLTVHCLAIAPRHLKKYQQVYAISDAVAHDIRQRAGVTAPVVLNGIPFKEVISKSHYINDNASTVRIVQVGRLVHDIKGQDLLLHALYKLVADGGHGPVTVDFIGTGSSQEYLQEMVNRLSLNGRVSFLGERSRDWIYEHLAEYDLLVQPSRSEGFGLTILEGIAAGLPVIASDHAGPKEILQYMPGCCLFEPDNADELALAIGQLIRHIRGNTVQSRCEASRMVAGRHYSIRKTAQEYLRHYSADLCA